MDVVLVDCRRQLTQPLPFCQDMVAAQMVLHLVMCLVVSPVARIAETHLKAKLESLFELSIKHLFDFLFCVLFQCTSAKLIFNLLLVFFCMI
jgi:hypothetical protein